VRPQRRAPKRRHVLGRFSCAHAHGFGYCAGVCVPPTRYADWDLAAKQGLDVFLRRELIGWDDDRLKLAQSARDGTAVSQTRVGESDRFSRAYGRIKLCVLAMAHLRCVPVPPQPRSRNAIWERSPLAQGVADAPPPSLPPAPSPELGWRLLRKTRSDRAVWGQG